MKTSSLVLMAVACLLAQTALGGIVAVNQSGYRPADKKLASTEVAADSFRVVDALTRAVVLQGPLVQAVANDPGTQARVYSADFTSLQVSGRYVLMLSTGDSSQQFPIGDTVYNTVYRKTLKGFYFQRCGTALLYANAGMYAHPACHVTTDGTFHATAESSGVANVVGGWHDAGDYGKYIVNAGISAGTLLMAYDWFPTKFAFDDLNIPESGNGIPDILDEVRYELAWFFTMQAANGGVFFKVTKENFENFVMPQADPGTRYIYQISTTATGDFGAVMARAARMYRPYDSTFAAACLQAATRAWSYLQAHPSIVPSGGFHNPSGTVTGEYGDGGDADERLWCAAEYYLTTGDSTAHTYVLTHYSSGGIMNGTMSWPNVKPLALFAYLRGSRPGMNVGAQTAIAGSLRSYAQTLLQLRNNSGYRTALGPYDYVWGSNGAALNNGVILALAWEAGGSNDMLEAAEDQLHYVTGVNVFGQSWITGIGAKHTMNPHHRPSASDGIGEPLPGLVSGGPDRNITDDDVLKGLFNSATPPARCYADNRDSYASNEICINWNAPLVFLAGYFSTGHTVSSVGMRETGQPRDVLLRQNYPNPFNSSTTIEFSLPTARSIDLTVVDDVGRCVTRDPLGTMSPGIHTVRWNALSVAGTPLASGVYFFYLTSAGTLVSDVRQLVLTR